MNGHELRNTLAAILNSSYKSSAYKLTNQDKRSIYDEDYFFKRFGYRLGQIERQLSIIFFRQFDLTTDELNTFLVSKYLRFSTDQAAVDTRKLISIVGFAFYALSALMVYFLGNHLISSILGGNLISAIHTSIFCLVTILLTILNFNHIIRPRLIMRTKIKRPIASTI